MFYFGNYESSNLRTKSVRNFQLILSGLSLYPEATSRKVTSPFGTVIYNTVWPCYTPSTLKNQAEFSVVSSCILALSTVTTNCLLVASLRWATGSDDKLKEKTKIRLASQLSSMLSCTKAGRVLRGSVVKCFTRSPEVLDSSCTGASVFSWECPCRQDTSEPQLVLVKPRKYMNNVNGLHDMTETFLKAA